MRKIINVSWRLSVMSACLASVSQVNMFCVLHTVATQSCVIVAKCFLRDEPTIVSLKAAFCTRTVFVVCQKHLVIFNFVFDIL